MKRIKYLGVLLSIVTLCVACEKSENLHGMAEFLRSNPQPVAPTHQNSCQPFTFHVTLAGFSVFAGVFLWLAEKDHSRLLNP